MKRVLILIAVFALMLSALISTEREEGKVEDFTLYDLEGNPVTLSELDGLIILDFWATWCPPCRVEIPYLQSFYDEYGVEGLNIVGISTEDVETQEAFVKEMREEGIDMSYHLLVDPDGEITSLYGIRGIPTTIFIDDDLNEIDREVGFMPEYAERFRRIIEENLPEED